MPGAALAERGPAARETSPGGKGLTHPREAPCAGKQAPFSNGPFSARPGEWYSDCPL